MNTTAALMEVLATSEAALTTTAAARRFKLSRDDVRETFEKFAAANRTTVELQFLVSGSENGNLIVKKFPTLAEAENVAASLTDAGVELYAIVPIAAANRALAIRRDPGDAVISHSGARAADRLYPTMSREATIKSLSSQELSPEMSLPPAPKPAAGASPKTQQERPELEKAEVLPVKRARSEPKPAADATPAPAAPTPAPVAAPAVIAPAPAAEKIEAVEVHDVDASRSVPPAEAKKAAAAAEKPIPAPAAAEAKTTPAASTAPKATGGKQQSLLDMFSKSGTKMRSASGVAMAAPQPKPSSDESQEKEQVGKKRGRPAKKDGATTTKKAAKPKKGSLSGLASTKGGKAKAINKDILDDDDSENSSDSDREEEERRRYEQADHAEVMLTAPNDEIILGDATPWKVAETAAATTAAPKPSKSPAKESSSPAARRPTDMPLPPSQQRITSFFNQAVVQFQNQWQREQRTETTKVGDEYVSRDVWLFVNKTTKEELSPEAYACRLDKIKEQSSSSRAAAAEESASAPAAGTNDAEELPEKKKRNEDLAEVTNTAKPAKKKKDPTAGHRPITAFFAKKA